jgi:hypothetical protein
MSDLAPGERYATADEAEIALNGDPKFTWHADEKGDVVIENSPRFHHHFVVVGGIDPTTGKVVLWRDDDTAQAVFSDGLTYDEGVGRWLNSVEVEEGGLDDDDAAIGEALAALLVGPR